MSKTVFGSLSRISDFERESYDIEKLDKSQWATGDYVECEVVGESSALYKIENTRGVSVRVAAGDRVVGALGVREATLEGVGDWQAVQNGSMNALTGAGLLGVFTSFSKFLPRPLALDYRGHIVRNGEKVCMADFAIRLQATEFSVPTVLLVGTSMSAGKTLTGKLACRVLSKAGLNVIGAKLTGAGRYHDILAFKSSGASEIYDFVDAGLPSTIVSEEEFRPAIRALLAHIQSRKPDVLVAEAGASPMEPYNGAAAIDELGDSVRCRILCASDPYAVVGVQEAFGLKPDLVTGPATNTSAAIALVKKLTGVPAINIVDRDSDEEFAEFLAQFGFAARTGKGADE